MKRLIIVLMILIPSVILAAEGASLDLGLLWENKNHTIKPDAKVSYRNDVSGLLITPFARIYSHHGTYRIHGKNCFDTIFWSYSGGLELEWNHMFVNGQYRVINSDDSKRHIWVMDEYWQDHRLFTSELGYRWENIADTGVGFTVSVSNNVRFSVACTLIELHYYYRYEDFAIGIYGSQKTWFTVGNGTMSYFYGCPYNDTYTVGAAFVWKNLSIYVEHFCSHDVYSNQEMWTDKRYRISGGVATGDIIGVRYSLR